MPERLGNALVSYVVYLGRLVCPVDLAVLYPRPAADSPIFWKAAAALMILAGITGATIAGRRKCPYFLVGWLWYLGMLFPVSGVLGFGYGAQWTANRFTYLPQIGLGIALVWGVAGLCRSGPHWRWTCGAASALALAAVTSGAWYQTSFWRDNETLWSHAIACTGPNALAHYNLGNALFDGGQADAAMAEFRRAIAIRPDIAQIHHKLGMALARRGRYAEAVPEYELAVQIYPEFANAYFSLGNALANLGRPEDAIAHYRQALAIDPNRSEFQINWALVLARQGRTGEAVERLRKLMSAIRIALPLTTNWATCWWHSARMTKPSYSFARRLGSSPTLPKPTTTGAPH
jgi:tetratricopeptide (TPR) repeat protein